MQVRTDCTEQRFTQLVNRKLLISETRHHKGQTCAIQLSASTTLPSYPGEAFSTIQTLHNLIQYEDGDGGGGGGSGGGGELVVVVRW